MATLGVMGHLSTEELGRRYRAARDRVERGHLQVIWLLGQGRGAGEVARVMGYSERWVAEIVRRYNEGGPERLGDRRRGNAGAKPLLDQAQREALARALQGAPPQGGLWSGPKVAAWIAVATGREVHPQRGWDYLGKLGFTLKRPRPRHAKADAAAQAAFKKGAAGALGRAAGGPSRRGMRAVGDG
jgi:transposase